MAELKVIKRVEMNDEYNVNLCNNGGCYSKPDITMSGTVTGKPATVIISDDSQGDFGSRFDIDVVIDGNKKYTYSYNDIEKAEAPEEYSDVPQDIADEIRKSFKEVGLHYWLLSETEVNK
jgi:hypothetical protein